MRQTYTHAFSALCWLHVVLRNFSHWTVGRDAQRDLCARRVNKLGHNCRIISLFRSKFNQSRTRERNGASRIRAVTDTIEGSLTVTVTVIFPLFSQFFCSPYFLMDCAAISFPDCQGLCKQEYIHWNARRRYFEHLLF